LVNVLSELYLILIEPLQRPDILYLEIKTKLGCHRLPLIGHNPFQQGQEPAAPRLLRFAVGIEICGCLAYEILPVEGFTPSQTGLFYGGNNSEDFTPVLRELFFGCITKPLFP